MSQDIFASTQQTPMMKPPRTPSSTPTRSTKRRSSVVHRPSATPNMAALKKEATLSMSMSQPLHYEDFYYLRNRQVPLANNMSELWAQFGINASSDRPGSSQEKSEQSRLKDKKERGPAQRKCARLLELLSLMVLSAFLGALCYAHFQHYFINSDSCPAALQIGQDSQVYESADATIESLELQNSILRLSEEIRHLQDHFSKIQENTGTGVISSPQRGILEELLTADLACAGNLGSVLATPDTTTVTVPATITILWLFSFHVDMKHRTPQTTIEGLIQEVGDCWPFQGSRGRLVLKLHRRSVVSGVSVSHIPPSVSVSGDVSSAPRLFQVLVHRQEDDLENGQSLGEFEYKISGSWRQTFSLGHLSTKGDPVDVVEFRFLKNHGHPNYTCVYRVHVHGATA